MVNALTLDAAPRSLLVAPQQRENKMRSLNFLAITIATLCLLLLAPAPSHAQRGKSQDVRSSTTPALSTNKPYVRPVAANTRDHRGKTGANNPAVTPSAEKRKSSTCTKSVLGGPCVGGAAGKALGIAAKAHFPVDGGQMFVRTEKSKSTKRSQTVDHRKK